MAITIEPTNVYIGLAIIGLFSGIGTAAGQYIFLELIKPRLHPIIEKANKIKLKDTKIDLEKGEIKIGK